MTSPHVAVVVLPMGSHTGFLFTVAKSLALAAPTTAFTFVCTSDSLISLSLSLSSTPDISNLRLCDALEIPGGDVDNFLKAMPGNLRRAVEAAEEEKEGGKRVTCIVCDSLMPMMGEVAEEMGVPWIPISSGAPAMALSQLYCDEISKRFKEEEKEKFLDITPGLAPFRFKDMPDFILVGSANGLNAGVIKTYPRAAAVAFNTIEGLEPLIDAELKSKFPNYLPIGPVAFLTKPPPVADDDKCIAWLNRQLTGSVVYISFGTFNTPTKEEMTELAEALMATGVPFLWSLIDKEGLPHSFFEHVDQGNGMMAKWAPQVQVLSHPAVGAFLSHGGWNSVMESIVTGVPMINRPFKWDQMMSVRMMTCVYGAGLTLNSEKGMKKEEIVRALMLVLEEEEGGEMREKVRALKRMSEAAVKAGGSSARNLNTLVEIMCGKS